MQPRMVNGASVAASAYDDLPLSLVLFRYLWPFWLFVDASRGDRVARAAAYRYNRGMRIYLPGYLLKWAISCLFAFGATVAFDSASASHAVVMNVMAASSGVAFAGSICVLFVTGYIYLYLDRNED
jgi:hypothetical protein